MSNTTLLYELDKVTGEIVTTLMSSKTTSMPGDMIVVEHTDTRLCVPQFVSLPQLRKLRTQFVKISQMHPPSNKSEMAKSFVEFLNVNLK